MTQQDFNPITNNLKPLSHRLEDGWSLSGQRSSPWKEWTGRLRERQLSFFRPSRRDGTGSNRPPIKELHRSANNPHGPGASSSKDSPCRSHGAGRIDSARHSVRPSDAEFFEALDWLLALAKSRARNRD